MINKQRGFTLLELMLVIAIIGILLAVSIPVYTDYIQRAKIYETLLLLEGLKSPVLEFAHVQNDEGRWPATPTSVGLATAGTYTTNITIAKPRLWAQVTSLMSEGSIVLLYNTTTKVWTCTHSPGFSQKYLPQNCR
ncbi:MAG: pilin [Pseudomonadota bacterium]